VRFGWKGEVCLPLYSLDDAKIMNVVRRVAGECPEGVAKVRGRKGCGTNGVLGTPDDLYSTHGSIILVEGVFDYLTALQWAPDNMVFGAHGVGNMPKIVRGLLPFIGERQFVFVAHRDRRNQSERALAKAIATGLEAGRSPSQFQVVYPGAHQDLNDLLMAEGHHEFVVINGAVDLVPTGGRDV
jgi:hypothetical protein